MLHSTEQYKQVSDTVILRNGEETRECYPPLSLITSLIGIPPSPFSVPDTQESFRLDTLMVCYMCKIHEVDNISETEFVIVYLDFCLFVLTCLCDYIAVFTAR